MSAVTPPQRFDPTADLPDGTLLLEASAGTGKTYTITSLVLRAVAEDGVALDRILVVTFTRAAAAELRGRIRARLAAALTAMERAVDARRAGHDVDVTALAGDDQVIAHLLDDVPVDELARRARRLRGASEGFDEATIDTIHGFCHAALHRAAPDVAVELGMELAEDVTELIDELVHDALVRELRDADDAWYRVLVDAGIGPDRLRAIAQRLEAEPALHVLPDRQRDDDPVAAWTATVERFRAAWRAQRAALVPWLKDHAKEGFRGTYYNQKRPDREAAALDGWCDEPVPPIGALDGIEKPVAYVARGTMEDRAVHPGAIPDHLDVIDAADALLAARGELATDVLLRFAASVRDELPRRKAERGVLSFGDLLARLDDALGDDATAGSVRAGIRTRFDMALIDEFQDTDPIQWRIFDRVFGEDARLQLIGDPKQAIYAFRGADVGTYLEAAEQVPPARRFTLSTNHRSDARYLAALQQLFGRDAFAPDGVFAVERIQHLPVEPASRHREDRLRFDDGPRPPLEIRYVPRAVAVEDGEELPPVITKGWAGPFLTGAVVREIVALLHETPTIDPDREDPRPVAPRDLAVLVRTNRQARQVQAALLDAGVPAVVESDESVLAAAEATAVQRLLDALLRPSSERLVRPALLGPIVGVTPTELDAADDATWDGWSEAFARWSRRWRTAGIAAVLRDVMDERGTAPRVLERPRGERVLTNLLHLRELLHRAAVTERLGPAGLAGWLREQRYASRSRVEERELRLESDADAVTVATIHRSKGLQYPIVWCPFLWEGRKLQPADVDVLRFRDPTSRQLCLDVTADRDAKARQRALAEREQWEESLRLLYVALTRAEHRCVVHTGPFRDSGSSSLARLLHGVSYGDGDDPGPPPDPKDRTDDELFAELVDLASDVVGVRRVEPLGPPVRWQPPGAEGPALTVRSFGRGLDTAWQRTSYSRLTTGELAPPEGTPRDEGRDHDHDVAEGPADEGVATPASDAAPLPLGAFPRGPEAGTFLHLVFEHLDFQVADAEVEEQVAERLLGATLDWRDAGTLARGVRAVLATPLGPWVDDVRLADIARADRLDELAFDLPLAGGYAVGSAAVSVHGIADVVEAHAAGSALPLEAFAARLRRRPDLPVRGFLTGSIDLVARVGGRDGRYLLADYKSNWLGADGAATVADYRLDRLVEAMLHHDYLLQASLYLVALHRFLRARLPGYDYDRHVAGFAYLFLRGMVGPDTPRGDDGTPYGVFAGRPSRALVEDLDAVLRGERP